MTKVKVCGITTVEDALRAVGLGADYIGVNFYPASPRFISIDRGAEIVAAVGDRATCVGVFANEAAEVVRKTCTAVGLEYAQLHGSESPAYCRELSGLKLIKAFPAAAKFVDEVQLYEVEGTLADAASPALGGTGKVCDWNIANELREKSKLFFLAGGLNAGNVEQAIRTVAPDVVDVCSGVESEPGRKDLQLMKDFFRSVAAAEQETKKQVIHG